ncbi:DUF4200 domain-containing protein [bacterium]|nr:DUF4200 domain-containing protein [bacterium]
MGLAASQVRLLTMKNRKSTVAFQLRSLSQKEISLANSMDRVAKEYTEALDNKSLQWTVSTGKYVDITYDRIMTPMKNINQCNPHIITNRDGRVLLDDKYNAIVSNPDYDDIFNYNPTSGDPPPSVRMAVIDYIESNKLGKLESTNDSFTYNTVSDTYYRDAKVSEVFDYLAGQIGKFDSNTDIQVISDIQLIVDNYKNNVAGYHEQDHAFHPASQNYYTSDSDNLEYYKHIREMFLGDDDNVKPDTGVSALYSLASIPSFNYTTADINHAIENAVNYFSKKSHVISASMTQAYPDELSSDVQGYMGTKISSYSAGPEVEDYCPEHNGIYLEAEQQDPEYERPKVDLHNPSNAAFSYRSFYAYVLAELSGFSNAFAADGNTETNLKIINEKPATVTMPSLEDMAKNILTVCRKYASINYPNMDLSKFNYSDALKWLENGFYNINSEKTANLNYCLGVYMDDSNNSEVSSTISSLFNAIYGDGSSFNEAYISSLNIYDNKSFERNTNSTIVEYWKGIEQDEIDFYTAIFEKIRDNGYYYAQHATDKDYLNLQLKNNNYLIDDLYVKSCPKIAMVCVNKRQQEEALSKYEAQMALINEKEEDIQLEIESLNTEYTMIKSEINSLKQIIKDNITSTFKMDA